MESEKKRSKNFNEREKQLLLSLVLYKYRDSIGNRRTDAAARIQKENAWRELAKDFSSKLQSSAERHWKSLRLCYENMKKRAKKPAAFEKVQLYKTGEGTLIEGKKSIACLKTQFELTENHQDGDKEFHPQAICDLDDNSLDDAELSGTEPIIEVICEDCAAEPDAQEVAQPLAESDVESCSKRVPEPPSCPLRLATKKRKFEEANAVRSQFLEKRMQLLREEKAKRIQLLKQEKAEKLQLLKEEKEERMQLLKEEKAERMSFVRAKYELKLEEHKLKMEGLELENKLKLKEIEKLSEIKR